MCGIFGYIGHRPAEEVLLDGLRRLEYRGYDSAGIAVLGEGGVRLTRAVGNLDRLAQRLAAQQGAPSANGKLQTGIGHTRWATHGPVSEKNAHPHFDRDGKIHVVVNGIVENHDTLRKRLGGEGVPFSSETDAEVIAHLIARHYSGDLAAAVRAALQELEGHFAFVALSAQEPGLLVGARRECPLIVGVGEEERFVASALPAFLPHTRRALFLEDGEVAVIDVGGVRLLDGEGREVKRAVKRIDWDAEALEKRGFETFMLKEIYEQADAVAETLSGHLLEGGEVELSLEGEIDPALIAACRRVVIVGCGTSYHAGLVGRYVLENLARLPVELDIASEYRYREPVLGEQDLVIGITQSGETADTLAAMREARRRGARVIALTNVAGSQATREADAVLYTRAGIEVGVAATKTFTTQVVALFLLALWLAGRRGTAPAERLAELSAGLRRIPHRIDELLGMPTDERPTPLVAAVREVADRHFDKQFFLYIGRNIGLPIALEGALKLKEIAYIATDAYAAGEMKHGPIALLEQSTPVVAIATDSPVLDKLLSNIAEVRARGAEVVAVCSEGQGRVAEAADHLLPLPKTDWLLAPVLAVVPLQLLAYEIAKRRGCNVDQPRNLAKTVTVE